MQTQDRRPDPDVLLAQAENERRGKLVVFLGPVAGVGKTYAMLEAAHEQLEAGVDVVIGWVETHGRAETEALAARLPRIPPKEVEYRGMRLREMDLDAILARRPQLVLVDELAHTNAPGSRHVRRYQDVQEIIQAGIDVYTTLNIQHIESLNDVVARITGVEVRETVPDSVVEAADQVELVDLPVEQLLERLREGKVYVPDQARRAMHNFFRPGNLHALRELALQWTTEHVDRQLRLYMRAHLIEGPWPARERLLVCVSPSPHSEQLVRAARRMASALRAPWLAVYVETPAQLRLSPADRTRVARTLRLAEELGAEALTVSGESVAEAVLRLVHERNVTQIVIGKPLRPRWRELLQGSLVDQIIRHSGGADVHVIRPHPVSHRRPALPAPADRAGATPVRPILIGAALPVGLTLLLLPLRWEANAVNTVLLYLLPVLLASRWGFSSAVAASLSGVLQWDFFFIPPHRTFAVSDVRQLLAFVVFLGVGMLTGSLTSRLRMQVQAGRQREDRLSALYAASRELAAAQHLDDMLRIVVRRVSESLCPHAAVLVPDESGRLEVRAQTGSGVPLGEDERAVAEWVLTHGEIAGRGSDTLTGARGLYVPLRIEGRTVGVLAVFQDSPERHLPPEQRRLLWAFAGLAAVAVERARLAREAERTRLLAESERLYSAIFNSLSHELRTPLATITGAVTSLLEADVEYSEEARRDLLETIRDEAARMNLLLSNLLDMARIESGAMRLRLDWTDLHDLVGTALNRLGRRLQGRPLVADIPEDLPLVQVDSVLMEQTLVNLLDNALRYSPPGSAVEIRARAGRDRVTVTVADRGPGVPEGELERIFEKFYRSPGAGGAAGGTGLGLSIARGVVEAHGGQIRARNREGGGLEVEIGIPRSPAPPAPEPAARRADGKSEPGEPG